MTDDMVFNYLKLVLDWVSVWAVLVLCIVIWLIRNPQWIKEIPTYVERAKFGDVEIHLRKIEQKLAETETQLAVIAQENARLNQLYARFDAHAPVAELEGTRRALQVVARTLTDLQPVLDGLIPDADDADVYAAAVILREKRDPVAFDPLIDCLDRIASDDLLEGLRYHTVWTLASAVHGTLIDAVKDTDRPKLSRTQLERARAVITRLRANPHVQLDRPDAPDEGIRGPARHALTWIKKGLAKHDALDSPGG